jgi:hypothetical protein
MKVLIFVLSSLLWSLGTSSTASFVTIGFQQITVPDPEGRTISVAIWYPSEGTAVSEPFGPFRQTVATGGRLSGAALPLILISHGSSGSSASHYATALALAEAGFLAAALTHTGDNYTDQSYAGNRKDLTDRPRQARVAGELLFPPRFLRIPRPATILRCAIWPFFSSISLPSWLGCSVLAASVPSLRSRFSSNTSS